MRTTAKLGLKVWNDPSDQFNPSEIAFNWDAIDAYANSPAPSASSIQKGAALPGGLVAGDAGTVFFLTAAASGFAANTLLEWNGTQWNVVGPRETLAAVPVSGNYAGRMVLLSAANGGFTQWSLIFYDGTTWQKVGGSVELATTVPASGNFAGRMVLLTSADSGFEAYSLIAYNGTSWNRTEKRGVELGTSLPGSPYAGQVFVVTAATGGFNAYDVVRWNGSTWARVGPVPASAYPGYEWDYKQVTADVPIGTAAVSEAAAVTIITSNNITYDGTRVKLEIYLNRLDAIGGTASDPRIVLLRDATVIGQFKPLQSGTAGNSVVGGTFISYDTPSAAAHTYVVKVFFASGANPSYTATAGTGTGTGTIMPINLRVTKA